MTSKLGFGLSPIGTGKFGFGTMPTANPLVGSVFTKINNMSGDCRYIDPINKDYMVDPVTGRLLGQDSAQQLVYLALITIKGTSSVTSLGQNFSTIKIISSNIELEIKNQVQLALNLLIKNKIVQLLDTVVEISPQKAIKIKITWKDLSNNIIITTTI